MTQSWLDYPLLSDILFLGGPALLVLMAGGLLYSGLSRADRFRLYTSLIPLTAVPFIILLQASQFGQINAFVIVPTMLATAASLLAGLCLLLLLPERFLRYSLLLALAYPCLLLTVALLSLSRLPAEMLLP
jgi:hypothetical protein